MRAASYEKRLPMTSLPIILLVGLCNHLIPPHEKVLPDEIETMWSVLESQRALHVQAHGPTQDDVAHYAGMADKTKQVVKATFGKQITQVARKHGLEEIERPDIAPLITVSGGSYNKREDESISGPGEPE